MDVEKKQRFWDAVQGQPDRDLTPTEKRELAALLRPGSALTRALCQAWFLSQETLRQFTTLDFAKPDAVQTAVRLQGRLQGMTQLVDVLLDLTEEKDDGSSTGQ